MNVFSLGFSLHKFFSDILPCINFCFVLFVPKAGFKTQNWASEYYFYVILDHFDTSFISFLIMKQKAKRDQLMRKLENIN